MCTNNECCGRALLNGDPLALIYTFDYTFCAPCADQRLGGSCFSCYGDHVLRPTKAVALPES